MSMSMRISTNQRELFPNEAVSRSKLQHNEIPLSRELLLNWQRRINLHQSKLFKGEAKTPKQGSFFPGNQLIAENFNPLDITPLALSFWRWPSSPHQGPAIYLVTDRPKELNAPILLYVGETIAADRRWKGEHDCKTYISAYSEALTSAGLTQQLSIRFWTDVPEKTPDRRKLEQELIQLWLPPFNKETRSRWSTPFTAEIN